MNPCRGLAWGCALLLLGTTLASARADESLFQECCNRCGPAVAAYPPPCTSCYPVATYYAAPRCGPLRRLFGRCCLRPVTSCQPCCPAPCPPPCAPAVFPGNPAPLPAPVLVPGATAVPNAVPLGPTPPPATDGYERHLTPVPQTPSPPLTGSSYRPERAPVPVRLDRIVSESDGPTRGQVEATPATLTRTAPGR